MVNMALYNRLMISRLHPQNFLQGLSFLTKQISKTLNTLFFLCCSLLSRYPNPKTPNTASLETVPSRRSYKNYASFPRLLDLPSQKWPHIHIWVGAIFVMHPSVSEKLMMMGHALLPLSLQLGEGLEPVLDNALMWFKDTSYFWAKWSSSFLSPCGNLTTMCLDVYFTRLCDMKDLEDSLMKQMRLVKT